MLSLSSVAVKMQAKATTRYHLIPANVYANVLSTLLASMVARYCNRSTGETKARGDLGIQASLSHMELHRKHKSLGEDLEKLESSCTARGNIKQSPWKSEPVLSLSNSFVPAGVRDVDSAWTYNSVVACLPLQHK